VITRTRAGLLALAGVTAITTTAATPAGPPQQTADRPALSAGSPLAGLRPQFLPRLSREIANPPRVAFPVRGPVSYGGAGARFGNDRGDHMHEGQDVFAPAGTPLVAVRDGVVAEAGNGGGRGNYVAIYSPAADRTYVYLHMQEPADVSVGQRVSAGRRVGEVGCTGSCFGDHLHFEIRRGQGANGAPQDPLPSLQRWARR
jgi:murein DD-endopeptidase MepM/ murein hydrolase activator NlpD